MTRDGFVDRHLGSSANTVSEMLAAVGYASLDELTSAVIPKGLGNDNLDLPQAQGEFEALATLEKIVAENDVRRALIGVGYYGCSTPAVIRRNILENPGWYTQYTPYQAEISQGRLEALLNYQTMVADLTGLPLANASLLDEATAAAEAMTMCRAITAERRREKDRSALRRFFVDADIHPQTLAVLQTRAAPLGIELEVGALSAFDARAPELFGALFCYPASSGKIEDHGVRCAAAGEAQVTIAIATDLLALTLLKPPGEFGADIAVGSAQRFGVPPGFGGPHAAFLATREAHRRHVPGRIIGVSKDAHGRRAYRMALQTREQHIRRERATSNICTAQVLLAIMAGFYGAYHGPSGLKAIATRVNRLTMRLAKGLRDLGLQLTSEHFFDTLTIALEPPQRAQILARAEAERIELRQDLPGRLGVSLDELSDERELLRLLRVFGATGDALPDLLAQPSWPAALSRASAFLTHPVFERYQTETEMLRYMNRLQSRDLSLTASMIPLGSCTMKLNGTSEMIPISWQNIASLHPFVPARQARGYAKLAEQLSGWLAEITGFSAVSLQPNAGAQGEYAGLLTIRGYHHSRGETQRDVCLIPVSAHGTNPASAVMAGMRVVAVPCANDGSIDIAALNKLAETHRDKLAALMVTYPSTHGVFEADIDEVCKIIHDNGGQVYLDGANLNALVGLCKPADFGADVCHLNLHKTFCIPHGGGGPGMGPIAVAQHLAPFLPDHPHVPAKRTSLGAVAAAPLGSASILPISWMYIAMMGAGGLRRASQMAILNANYMVSRLREHYPILYTGKNDLVAHEFILDLRPFKRSADISPDDVAKRLVDYGFHAPTMSWPVAGTLMIEPTESESRAELDRFCDAMIGIRQEIADIEAGRLPRDDNPLHNAPHTAEAVCADDWSHPYSRERAAYPDRARQQLYKFWPAVSRIDNAFGDRNLICTCPSVEELAES